MTSDTTVPAPTNPKHVVDGVEYARASGPTLAQAEETAAHVAHRALSFQPFRHIVGLTVVI